MLFQAGAAAGSHFRGSSIRVNAVHNSRLAKSY